MQGAAKTRGLPKRLELLFRVVVALPKLSSTGLLCSSRSFTLTLVWPAGETAAMNSITFLAASVLPAPDSPETRMHWSLFWERSAFHAASATAKT